MIDRPLNPVIDEPAQSGNATDATAKRNTGSENVILPHSAIRDLCELSSSISSELHEGQIIAPPLLQMLLFRWQQVRTRTAWMCRSTGKSISNW